MLLRTACLLLSAASAARAAAMHLGVDVSTPVPAAAAACMKSQHAIDFAISRAWYSDGAGFDKSCVESGASFKAAGVAFDVYMCVSSRPSATAPAHDARDRRMPRAGIVKALPRHSPARGVLARCMCFGAGTQSLARS